MINGIRGKCRLQDGLCTQRHNSQDGEGNVFGLKILRSNPRFLRIYQVKAIELSIPLKY